MLFNIFYAVIKMNCTATIIAILVLAMKYILQKIGMPRKFTILLWFIIGFRLICPIAISTDLSVFNLAPAENDIPQQVQISVQSNDLSENNYVVQNLPESNVEIKPNGELEILKTGVSIIWLLGMCSIVFFGIISYLMLKKRLRFAIKLQDNIYTADNIPTSFVFGIFAPKIYIPETVDKNNLQYIIAHEQTHIKRADHITKIIAYIFLAIHWFNPLIWIMFKLFSSDIEFACDESAIAKIGFENKKDYLTTLMTSAMINKENKVLLYSVCFSSNPTKRRIKNMMKLRKCPKIITLVGVGLCVLAFMIFGTNAMERTDKDKTVIADSSVVADIVDKKATVSDVVNLEYPIEISTASESENSKTVTTQSNYTKSKTDTSLKSTTTSTSHSKKQTTTSDSVGFSQNNADISNIEQELKTNGATKVNNENVVSGDNYTVKQYSFQNGCNDTLSNVTCNENGEVSLCFNINTESLVDITITDSATKKVIDSFGILANDESSYTFSGLDKTKTYDIVVEGQTGSDWKVEGQYIVY